MKFTAKAFRDWGKIGGNKTKQKFGIDHYREMGRKSALTRWKDKNKSGIIKDNGKESKNKN